MIIKTVKELKLVLEQIPDNMEVAVYRNIKEGTPVLCGNPKVHKMLDVLVIE